MSRSNIFLYSLLMAIIILHLVFKLDYSELLTPENKGPATGIMISVLGIISLVLSQRVRGGVHDVSGNDDVDEE